MKRLILVATLMLVLPSAAWAACGGASPRWIAVNPPTVAEVQDCVNKASPGDRITVTGNATWTSTLTLTRGVHLVGVGNPTITGQRVLVYWNASAAARTAHDVMTISGFTFDADNATYDQVQSAGIIALLNAASDYVRVVIRNNVIKNVQASGRGIYVSGRVYGVISGNTFQNTGPFLGTYGGDYNSWYYETQAYGVAENLYVEDNLVYPNPIRAYGGGQGGRAVLRYNDFDYTGTTTRAYVWEVHGLQSMQAAGGGSCGYPGLPACDADLAVCQQYSTMVFEVYGNTVHNVATSYDLMTQRGGWMLFHHNYHSATVGTGNIEYAQYGCDSCQYYYPNSPYYGPFVQHVANTYVWNNFDNTARMSMTKYADYCADSTISSPSQYTITADRDYFSDKYATFNGTSGVGCGNAAAFTKMTTCTTGVGYWVTDQSCTSLTGMIGRNPATPISGTLYKCKSTNTWQTAGEAYTPYTYPHPLTVAPAAPTSARVK